MSIASQPRITAIHAAAKSAGGNDQLPRGSTRPSAASEKNGAGGKNAWIKRGDDSSITGVSQYTHARPHHNATAAMRSNQPIAKNTAAIANTLVTSSRLTKKTKRQRPTERKSTRLNSRHL